MKKILRIIAIYIIVAFIIFVTIGALRGTVPSLLPGYKTTYSFNRGLLLFFKVFPAVLISAYVIGSSLAFGHSNVVCQTRFSIGIYRFYKTAVCTAILVTALITFVSEIGTSFIEQKQKQMENEYHIFSEYLSLGTEDYESGNIELSYQYAERALALSPGNAEAVTLMNESEKARETTGPEPQENITQKNEIVLEGNEYTVYELLKKSKDAASQGKWFDSHYYAQLAVDLADSKDVNFYEAKAAAAEAWNKLSSTATNSNGTIGKVFKQKMEGYTALLNGDCLKAYYIFHRLSAESMENAKDPDIERYLSISIDKVKQQYFFIDETTDIKRFEKISNVLFSLKHLDGSQDVVFIRGLTPMEQSGKVVQYIDRFAMYSFDVHGSYVSSVSVPFAKMLSVPAAYFGNDLKFEKRSGKSMQYVPYILLTSVDRNKEGVVSTPVYHFVDETVKHKEDSSIVLPMSYNDFTVLSDASVGSNDMYLGSLLQLISKADSYGYSAEVFEQVFIRRVFYPFLILVILMFASSFAWNYRIGRNQFFKFLWIFFMPVITAVVYIMFSCFLYIASLLDYAFLGTFGHRYAVYAIFAVYVGMFILSSVIFLARKS